MLRVRACLALTWMVVAVLSAARGAVQLPPEPLEARVTAPVAAVEEGGVPAHREPPPAPPALPPEPTHEVPPIPSGPLDPGSVGGLQQRLLDAFSRSRAAQLGIAVEVEGLGPVVDMSGSEQFVPASTEKLFTGGAALLILGPDMRFRTEVVRSGEVVEGTVRGDLVLVGSGDPTLTRADLASLAAEVARTGIRYVAGGLFADDSRYDRDRAARGWQPEFVPKEIGPLSAVAVDRNWHRSDPAFVDDPAAGNLELFRSALRGAGVRVAAPSRTGRPEGQTAPVAAHESAPLSSIVAHMLKESDNFEAEMILKELGRTIGDPSSRGGVEVVARLAHRLGIPRGSANDGSGLSLENRETPWHEVEWLKRIGATEVGEQFRASLAVACAQPGTLRNRLCATPAAGRVFAKTGSLANVRALAGYTSTASGRRVWYSFILSGDPATLRAAEAMDRALLEIATFSG